MREFISQKPRKIKISKKKGKKKKPISAKSSHKADMHFRRMYA